MGIHEQGSLSVEDLFSGRQEVRLSYEGQEYRLRITRNRKLILTK
ncbi:MAG TPA: hemin uptake protein HemP [Phycisphaerae bacterium]|nr:hemin uptake protein HemP [Phycisphaerae bacterium]